MSDKTSHNKLTTDAGLRFNVNKVKGSLKTLYTKSQGVDSKDLPKFRAFHVAVAAALERMSLLLLKELNTRVPVGKSGLKTIHRADLRNALGQNVEMAKYFESAMSFFVSTQTYEDSLCVDHKDVRALADSKFEKMNLNDKSWNLFFFLLDWMFRDMAVSALQCLEYSGRRTLDGSAALVALKLMWSGNKFSSTRVWNELSEEVKRAVNAVKHSDDDEDEDAKDTKDSKKKTTKKTTKNASQVSEDEGSDSGSDSEDAGSASESESETEETKKKPTKKTNKKGGKKGGRSARR